MRDWQPPHAPHGNARRMVPVPLESYAAVLFDCDGTLADTMPAHHRAWQAALREHHAPFEFPWELFLRRAGMKLENTVAELNRQFGAGLDPEAVAQAQRRHYDVSLADVQPIEFVLQLAEKARALCPLAVASGSEVRTVERTLESLGIRSWFRAVVTANDVSRGKPFPDMFVLAAERIGVLPSRCLVVEDAELGVEAAHRAGMDALRVDRDGSSDWLPAPRAESPA